MFFQTVSHYEMISGSLVLRIVIDMTELQKPLNIVVAALETSHRFAVAYIVTNTNTQKMSACACVEGEKAVQLSLSFSSVKEITCELVVCNL